MPRKTYRSKAGRNALHAQLPVILPGFFDHAEGLYEVTMTNGSGRKVVTMNGTQESVWGWAVQAGQQGGIGQGVWFPVGIELVEAHDEAQAFAALV